MIIHYCDCRDCFDITYGPHLCLECREAGCESYNPKDTYMPSWHYQCQREDLYDE